MTEQQTNQNANVEGLAILSAIRALDASAPTACEGWTVHEVVAHLAAGAKEIADLAFDTLEGRPERPTRGFEEREAPFRALPHDELIDALVEENMRKLRAYAGLEERSDAAFAFTGARVNGERLATHSRSEAAIHRWDLVGDDPESVRLLAQAELTAHAAWVLNAMPVLDESGLSMAARAEAAGHPQLAIAFRSGGEPDVVLRIGGADNSFTITPQASTGDVDLIVSLRPDHRLLVLWGRRPARLDVDLGGNTALWAELDGVLWPHAIAW